MKKIIITLMVLSMVLVSCSSPTSPDDYSTLTNSTISETPKTDEKKEVKDETPKTDEKKDESKNELKVTFNSNGGSSVEAKTVSNGKIIVPSNPAKEYCEFAYWYKDNEDVPFDFDSTITESIELKAKWYVHYFELGNGEDVKNLNYIIVDEFGNHNGIVSDSLTETAQVSIGRRNLNYTFGLNVSNNTCSVTFKYYNYKYNVTRNGTITIKVIK